MPDHKHISETLERVAVNANIPKPVLKAFKVAMAEREINLIQDALAEAMRDWSVKPVPGNHDIDSVSTESVNETLLSTLPVALPDNVKNNTEFVPDFLEGLKVRGVLSEGQDQWVLALLEILASGRRATVDAITSNLREFLKLVRSSDSGEDDVEISIAHFQKTIAGRKELEGLVRQTRQPRAPAKSNDKRKPKNPATDEGIERPA